MALGKFLRRIKGQHGQSSVEFFVLFSVVALLTLLSLTTFYPKVQDKGNEVFDNLSRKIVSPTVMDLVYDTIHPEYTNRQTDGWGSGQLQENATDQWNANPLEPLNPDDALANSTVTGLAANELADLNQRYNQYYPAGIGGGQ